MAGSFGDRLSAPGRWFFCTCYIEDGRTDIDEVGRRMAQLSASVYSPGPMSYKGRGGATFEDPGLVTSERSVGGIGKTRSKAKIAVFASRRNAWVMASASYHYLGARSVVGGEADERVFESVHALELVDDPSDLFIHAIDHRRVYSLFVD